MFLTSVGPHEGGRGGQQSGAFAGFFSASLKVWSIGFARAVVYKRSLPEVI